MGRVTAQKPGGRDCGNHDWTGWTSLDVIRSRSCKNPGCGAVELESITPSDD